MAANRAVDDYAINICNIPGKTLMNNAGKAVIREIRSHDLLPEKGHVLVLAGKGNNGGDGFVIALGLAKLGFNLSLITVTDETELAGDAHYYFQKVKEADLKWEVWTSSNAQRELISGASLIIDALLGTGVSGEIRTPYLQLIEQCNLSKAQVVAVDIPSGVSGDIGHVLFPCMKAELTVSMGYGKQGCLFEPARSQCGVIEIVDIGFPEDSLRYISDQVLYELNDEDFPPQAFTRAADSNKYSTGKVYIIAGSRGYSGAALLASTAALRAGAGLVKLALPTSLCNIAESISLETIVEGVPETIDESFSLDAYSALKAGSEWADVVAIGPGIGRYEDTLELARQMIEDIERPLIIDADALYALSQNIEILKERKAPTILTPHLGEFRRLFSNFEGEKGTLWQLALKMSQEYGVFILLKGAPSILATPDGEIAVNSTGYAGMATAGSGDVLTGVLAGLWSQWNSTPAVLNFAMHIHGRAAEFNRSEKGVLGLIASDIVNTLPAALKGYGGVPN
ncbi:MAG: NAD(P)H-hydrate dehydratase [Candidatus Marinimicrobia bacterium]|nr:NAD(P)H-hydrate dehydratase [Candidatus Neomarinimicrobiota bacterium]